MPKLVATTKQIRLTLNQALENQQKGNYKAAERKYRNILKVAPRHTDVLQYLAILLQQTGKPKAACHFMQQALKISPDHPVLLSNQAEIYRMQGNFELAEKFARQALRINPELVDAVIIVANARQVKSDFESSADYYSQAMALAPNAADVRNELANVLCCLQRYGEAVNHYRIAIRQNPEFIECRLNLADTLITLQAYEEAITEFNYLLTTQPDNISLLLKLAQALISNNQPDEARNYLDKARQTDPNHSLIYYWLGIYEQTLGNFELATRHFEHAMQLGMDIADPWYRLSLNRSFKPSADQLSTLQARFQTLNRSDQNDSELVPLGFALARFYEQQNDFELSFQYYQTANRIKSGLKPFDSIRHNEQIENIVNVFNANFYADRTGWGNATRKPVFIVGMPRSGTTLTEQIISTHSEAHGGGELTMMLNLMSNIRQKGTTSACGHAHLTAELNQSEIKNLADQYLIKLSQLNDSATVIIDKLPGNYFRLGVILLLFPNARIIHCNRHAVATCWSCYQQNFERGLKFTNDFDDLVVAYKGYKRLMDHWHKVKPGSIFDLRYENLLDDPQQHCRELLDFCGLDWDPAVLNFYQQQRPVSTASAWQVRQPFDRGASNRWKAYEPFLQALKAGLDFCH